MNGYAVATGNALVRIRGRRGLSQSETARRAGISVGHLSRIESGERQPSEKVARQLASALDVEEHEFLLELGVAPAEVIALAGDALYGLAFAPGVVDRTRDALRRLHIGVLVERWRRRGGGEVRIPVDPAATLRAMGYTVAGEATPQVRFGPGRNVSVGSSDDLARRRFLLAHSAGHAALEDEPACDLDSVSDRELDASAFAAFLLLPRTELRRAVMAVGTGRDMWGSEGVGVLAEVAERFGVPLWLAARRGSEEGFLAELAEVGER